MCRYRTSGHLVLPACLHGGEVTQYSGNGTTRLKQEPGRTDIHQGAEYREQTSPQDQDNSKGKGEKNYRPKIQTTDLSWPDCGLDYIRASSGLEDFHSCAHFRASRTHQGGSSRASPTSNLAIRLSVSLPARPVVVISRSLIPRAHWVGLICRSRIQRYGLPLVGGLAPVHRLAREPRPKPIMASMWTGRVSRIGRSAAVGKLARPQRGIET